MCAYLHLMLLLHWKAFALSMHAARSSWAAHVSCWFMPGPEHASRTALSSTFLAERTATTRGVTPPPAAQEIKSKAEWRPVEDIKLANKLNPRFGLNWVKLRAWEQSDLDAIIMVVGEGGESGPRTRLTCSGIVLAATTALAAACTHCWYKSKQLSLVNGSTAWGPRFNCPNGCLAAICGHTDYNAQGAAPL